MDKTTLEMLSTAFGDLARGFKKLKCVANRNILASGKEDVGKHPKIEQVEAKSPEDAEPSEIPHDPLAWLLDPSNDWSGFRCTLTYLYGKTLRGDRFKNHWVKDDTQLRGWRKVSASTMKQYMDSAATFHDEMVSLVQFYPLEYDRFLYDYDAFVPEEKWKRRSVLWEPVTEEKEFREWLVSTHEDLPTLK